MVEHLHSDGEEPCVTLDAFLEQSNATAVRQKLRRRTASFACFSAAVGSGTSGESAAAAEALPAGQTSRGMTEPSPSRSEEP